MPHREFQRVQWKDFWGWGRVANEVRKGKYRAIRGLEARAEGYPEYRAPQMGPDLNRDYGPDESSLEGPKAEVLAKPGRWAVGG